MNHLLKRDICNIGDPFTMNEDVKDLESKRRLFLPPELCYACKHWLVHLIKATSLDEALAKELNTFCTHHLLHWIEVLSLLDKVSVAHINLPEAVEYCRVSLNKSLIGAFLIRFMSATGEPRCH